MAKYYVGQIVKDKMGEDVKIIEIVKSDNYLFEWPDGYQRRCQSNVIRLGTLMRERDSSRLNPRARVGQVFENNQGVEYKIIEKESNNRILIEFLTDSHYKVWTSCGNALKGNIHYPFLPTVCGKGVLGLFKVDIRSYQYTSWVGLLKRIYLPNCERTMINYGDCQICEDWHLYENFHRWSSKQKYFAGWQLDKDLLVKGNKLYNEDSCIYLPREINSFLTDRANLRGDFPVGVTIRPNLKNYQAACSVDGVTKYLGVFDPPEEAFNAYKSEKELQAKILAERWKNKIDKRAYRALINYEVLITD